MRKPNRNKSRSRFPESLRVKGGNLSRVRDEEAVGPMTQTSVQARPTVTAEASASIVCTNDVDAVELTVLSRFEGEGGREVPGTDGIEARPDAAIWK